MTRYLNRTARIQQIVASYYRIDYEHMFSPVRDSFVCQPRQVAMYLTREFTEQGLVEIGRRFRKDHTTVLNGIRKVEKRLKTQPWLSEELDTLRRKIERETQDQALVA